MKAHMSSKIAPLDKGDIHRITSGQVITELTSVVKELLDNSIDSGADHIEFTFRNYGLESLECADNGSGIDEVNYNTLALKYHTSKISSFQDISELKTLGFRGEALSSMCAIANLSVTTATNPPRGAKLEFGFDGSLTKKSIISRNKGTTMCVSHLFNNLPVRRKEFTRNHKRQFSKCISLLQAYALDLENTKLSVWHITSSGRKTLVLSSAKTQDLPKRILSVLGSSSTQHLDPIELSIDLLARDPLASKSEVDDPPEPVINVKGLISKCSIGCGRTSKDRQFISINKRPVIAPALAKCFNEIYKSFNHNQYPAFFLELSSPTQMIDINVTPDKRTVLLHKEDQVIDQLRDSLNNYFSSQDIVFPISATESKVTSTGHQDHSVKRQKIEEMELSPRSEKVRSLKGSPLTDTSNSADREGDGSPRTTTLQLQPSSFLPKTQEPFRAEHSQTDLASFSSEPKEPPVKKDLQLFSNPAEPEHSLFVTQEEYDTPEPVIIEVGDTKVEETARLTRDNRLLFKSKITESHESIHNHSGCSCSSGQESSDDEANQLQDAADEEGRTQGKIFEEREELNGETPIPEVNVRVSIPKELPATRNLSAAKELASSGLESLTKVVSVSADAITRACNGVLARRLQQAQDRPQTDLIKNDKLQDLKEGENYLTLTVSKKDFKQMEIVGQFNLGFIIVTRKQNSKYDLFIVDQHASDEKYNFEVLQRTTNFKSQRLIAPRPIEMSIIDELVVLDNLEVFEKNGFKLKIAENEEVTNKPRVEVVSLPVSRKTMFDLNDLQELIHLVKDSDGLDKSSIRCSKIRAMFAMRACRSSVMVGKPLTRKSMTQIVRNLSELDKPWNCPHGRPTMRHLMELRDWKSFNEDYDL
ncbi:LAMI_0C10462g1_1 [Lachancea mirantina]|uniref:LAMI_0C10462g1_1 n=1 Tax=Lachancea mirantina TaxID=1230905 RepID=A0A1G4J5U8_9SACH|nr:LAMI_0C10462g1_1 [Lachancea mirantina]